MATLKRIFTAVLVAMLVFTAGDALAVGTVTSTATPLPNGITAITITWTADSADGSVPATVISMPGQQYLYLMTTDPDGTTAPTDNYDITLVVDGTDVAGGALADRDTATNEQAAPLVGGVPIRRYLPDAPTFTLTGNSVNSAAGTLTLYLSPDGSLADATGEDVVLGSTTIVGPLTLNESLGPELITLDATCTGTTLTAGWSCTAGVISHDGAGTGTATIPLTGGTRTGAWYKLVLATTMTVTTGGITPTLGGVSQANIAAAGTATYYFPAGTAGALILTPGNTALRAVCTSISVKEDRSVITTSAGPIVIYKELSDPTANQSGVNIVVKQTGAGGNKTALTVEMIGSGTGSEYLTEWKADGAVKAYVLSSGEIATTNVYTGAVYSTNSSATLSLIGKNNPGIAGGTSVNVTFLEAMTNTSGNRNILSITPTYNQASGTAANTDVMISRIETALGSGAQKFISMQSGAAGTTERFSVSNVGIVTAGGGSASAGVCWKADAITLGYCSGGLGLVCGTCL